MAPFADRSSGGRELAGRLAHLGGRDDVVVLGLPRGGVPVAYEVAHALNAPLDVLVVRKLGVPAQPELAFGAIATGGTEVLNRALIAEVGLSAAAIERVIRRELEVLRRRERALRAGRAPLELGGRIAVLVDDGLATGATMRAAIEAVRARGPARILATAPVGAAETLRALQHVADEVVCAFVPQRFRAVGLHYADFRPTTDAEIRRLLAPAA